MSHVEYDLRLVGCYAQISSFIVLHKQQYSQLNHKHWNRNLSRVKLTDFHAILAKPAGATPGRIARRSILIYDLPKHPAQIGGIMTSEDRKIKDALLSDLEARRTLIEKMGGEANVARQLKRGKLTARGRIDALLDEGTFQEIGAFAINRAAGDEPLPADGVITGYGEIGGRPVYVFAQDFTCAGGTLSETHAQKICRVLELATKAGCPVIGLNDSGGARIQDGVDALSGYGKIFYRNTMASGVIPQICAIIGPCAGGAVYSPALMDFIFMVKGISCAFITGPRVVKAVMGQEISEEELGGALVAQRKAGVVCRSEDSEAECLTAIRELLSFLPPNNRHLPPRLDTDDPPERRDKHLFDIIPANPRRSYDMHRVIERIFDRRPDGGKNCFELFPIFATNMITCFARLNGHSVGVVANQPRSKAGAIDSEVPTMHPTMISTSDMPARRFAAEASFDMGMAFTPECSGSAAYPPTARGGGSNGALAQIPNSSRTVERGEVGAATGVVHALIRPSRS